MADFIVTPAVYESVLALYVTYGYQPVKVARKLGVPHEVVTRLYDEGIPGIFAPLEGIVKERRDAKKALKEAVKNPKNPPLYEPMPQRSGGKLHVGDVNTPPHSESHSSLPSHTTKTLVDSEAPRAPTLDTPIPTTPPVASPPSQALTSANTPADLQAALDHVHGELSKALYREQRLVGGLREQAIGVANGSMHAVRAYEAIIKRLSEQLLLKCSRDEIEERRAMTLLTKLTRLVGTATKVARDAIELQRLVAGLPQSISAEVSSKAPKDALTDLDAITAQLTRLQTARRGRTIDADVVPYEGEESDK